MPTLNKINKKKILVFFFITLIMSTGLALLLKSQVFRLHHIKVEVKPGSWSKKLSQSVREDMIRQMEPFKGKLLLTIPLKKVISTLQSDFRIHNIRVQRKLPDSMELKMELRQPLALLMGLRGELLFVSRDARLLPPMGEVVDLPILRGINFHRSRELRVQALQMLKEIPTSGLASRQNISEIRFDKKFGYILYLLPHGGPVYLGQGEFAQKIGRVEKVMNYLQSQNMKYRVIDARFLKKVVVKPRNAS